MAWGTCLRLGSLLPQYDTLSAHRTGKPLQDAIIADKIKACTGGLAISTCKLHLLRHNSIDTY